MTGGSTWRDTVIPADRGGETHWGQWWQPTRQKLLLESFYVWCAASFFFIHFRNALFQFKSVKMKSTNKSQPATCVSDGEVSVKVQRGVFVGIWGYLGGGGSPIRQTRKTLVEMESDSIPVVCFLISRCCQITLVSIGNSKCLFEAAQMIELAPKTSQRSCTISHVWSQWILQTPVFFYNLHECQRELQLRSLSLTLLLSVKLNILWQSWLTSSRYRTKRFPLVMIQVSKWWLVSRTKGFDLLSTWLAV